MISQIESRTLREKAYRAIKDSILKNELLPGQDLYINSLASALNISQTPVREALSRLSADGLIDYEPHKKLRVAKITEEDVRQVYEVRKLLEPYAASLVAAAMPKNSRLRNSVQRIHEKEKEICRTAVDCLDYGGFMAIDLRLNEIFLQAAGETFFREVLTFTGDRSMRIRTFREAVSKAHPTSMIHEITKEHLAITRALLDGDHDEVRRAVHQHLINAEARTLHEISDKLNP